MVFGTIKTVPYVGVNDWPQPVHGAMTSIVPYKLFAAFIIIGKVSLRRDEGIPPYRDKVPFGVYTKKAELLTALLLHFMGIS